MGRYWWWLVRALAKPAPATTSTGTYFRLLDGLGNEFSILLDVPIPDIETSGGGLLAEAIRRMRAGEVSIAPGYDGEFGTIQLYDPEERQATTTQMALF